MKKLLLALTVAVFPSIQPISQNVVYAGTAATGLGCGLLTYQVSKSILLGAAIGCGSSFLAYQILNQFTPEGRLNRARAKFEYISRHKLAMREFSSEQEFFNTLSEVYVLSDLPLIMAYKDLAFLIELGYEVLSLLDAAKSDSNFEMNIIEQCDILIPRVHRALSLMTEAIKRIRASADYLKQVEIYKEMQAAQEKLAVQKQIAYAQTQMANAQMHQAYNR